MTFIHHFSSSLLHWFIFIIHLFHYTINHFVFCETGKIDNLSAVGGKVFWLSVCRFMSVESTFTLLLLISMSYWFDKPRFDIEGKLLLAASPPSLGALPNSFHHTNTRRLDTTNQSRAPVVACHSQHRKPGRKIPRYAAPVSVAQSRLLTISSGGEMSPSRIPGPHNHAHRMAAGAA